MMLAAHYFGIKDVKVKNAEKPVCSSGQVLVKVFYAGICGSDLHNYRKGMFMTYTPEIMGHEFSGTVIDTAEDVTDFLPGDHVIGDPRVGCGGCLWCKNGETNLCPNLGFIGEVAPGCFAEYLTLDSRKLIKISKKVDLKEAALVEPLSVALHIIGKANLKSSDTLGIIGAGPIGLLTLMAAKALYGCRVDLVDIAPGRLLLAKELGADYTFAKIPEPGNYVDAAVEAVGLGVTLNDCLAWLKPQGRLIMAGLYEDKIEFDPNPIVAKEIAVFGINAYETEDIKRAVCLIEEKSVDVKRIISHVFSLSGINEAFDLLDSKKGEAVKVLIEP